LARAAAAADQPRAPVKANRGLFDAIEYAATEGRGGDDADDVALLGAQIVDVRVEFGWHLPPARRRAPLRRRAWLAAERARLAQQRGIAEDRGAPLDLVTSLVNDALGRAYSRCKGAASW